MSHAGDTGDDAEAETTADAADAAMPRLVSLTDATTVFDLNRSRTTVGRAETNSIMLLQRSVSGKHAVIEVLEGGGAVVHDTGSDGAKQRCSNSRPSPF